MYLHIYIANIIAKLNKSGVFDPRIAALQGDDTLNEKEKYARSIVYLTERLNEEIGKFVKDLLAGKRLPDLD